MDTKPIRAEMIQSYIAQLRASLGGVKPVGEGGLRELFRRQDYTGMVKVIRDNMGLDLRVRVGLVNEGGPAGAPAWVSAPKQMPRLGTAEFQRTLVTIFLRKSFVNSHYFEEVAIAIAHELSHIVLFGINHPLQDCEEAVDLTAMLLGYRDLYVAGSFREVRPASFWKRVDSYIKKRFTGVERRTYHGSRTAYISNVWISDTRGSQVYGCHSRNASRRLARSSIDRKGGRTMGNPIGRLFLRCDRHYRVRLRGFAPTLTKTPQPQLAQNACASRPQPNPGVYARYDQSLSVAPLTLGTEAGSNYFVKINDVVSGRPILSFFAYGGSTLQVKVPAGSFVLKYAAGENWCGERNYSAR
jgi:hypothetical protein